MDLDTSLPLQPCSCAELINMTKDSNATDHPISSEEVEPIEPEGITTTSFTRKPRFITPPSQTGDAAATSQDQGHTPVTMEVSGIVLDDHEIPSIDPYVLHDLQHATQSDTRDWCTVILGKNERELDIWRQKIKEQKWFHDHHIQQALIDFCTVGTETARYEPFTRVANRLVHLARGNLPGIPNKNSFPIDDICFAIHSDRPVEPIPEHGILAAERKPDIVMARRSDCCEAPTKKGKMKLRWTQIISFMEFKATRNLRAILDNKRVEEGLPFIWQQNPTKKVRYSPFEQSLKFIECPPLCMTLLYKCRTARKS